MTSADIQLTLELLDLASCFICQLKWGLFHSKNTIKMCLMKVIERKREKNRPMAKSSRGWVWGGVPYRSHFKHNSENIFIESLKYHFFWVENVWKGSQESRHRFAGAQLRGNQVRGAGIERSRFNM